MKRRRAGDVARIEAQIEALAATIAKAEAAESFAPAVAARVKLIEIQERLARVLDSTAAAKRKPSALQRLRAARLRAERDGSHVAGGQLLRAELEEEQRLAAVQAEQEAHPGRRPTLAESLAALEAFVLDPRSPERAILALERALVTRRSRRPERATGEH